MSKSSNQLGIIYRIVESGHKDKILHVLNINGSKESLIAKGVRESKSKRSSSIELGNKIFYKSIETGGELDVLGDVTVRETFVSDDYKKLILIQAFCEIVDKFAINEGRNVWLYNLFEESLVFTKQLPRLVFVAYFIIKSLSESGLLPDLNECAVTNENLVSDNIGALDDQLGFINVSSIPENYFVQKIDDKVYKVIKFFLNSDLSKISRLNISSREEELIVNLCIRWLEVSLEREFNSKNTIKSINQLG